MSNRRHRSTVDVLAHAAKEAHVLHDTASINANLGDLESVETAQIDPRQVRRDVQDLFGRIGMAPDTASERGVDVARRRRAYGERRRFMWLFAAPTYDCKPETHAAPEILTHAVLGPQPRGVGPSVRVPTSLDAA